ncbi:MAG: His/Gly/Thr/Pro-type tRNA ligase C-terminal domain-containing protein, partial [Polyangiaceae bacterium]|nr:His/Gly/Thr/Pro-type tRNA ligase C-terminal domain-containing protein [Polyangiaceae bacterium]
YTRTCFELVAESGEIGSQNAILGGGRYDGMLETLGGKSTPAIGFAMGLERILLAMPEQEAPEAPLVYIAPLGSEPTLQALPLAQNLRVAGLSVELDGRGNSMKSMLRRANSMGARWALILGESEVNQGLIQVKDLQEHAEEKIQLETIEAYLKEQLAVTTTQRVASAQNDSEKVDT